MFFRSVFLLIVGCIVYFSLDIPAEAEEEPQIRRTLLLVRDIEKSIDFYTRVGLTRWCEEEDQGEPGQDVLNSSRLPLAGLPGYGRIVMMMGDESRNGLIALLHYGAPPLAETRRDVEGLGYGNIMFLIDVSNLDDVHAALTEIGTRFYRQPFPLNTVAKDGAVVNGRIMMVYDPDGHVVQIVQVD